MPDITDLQEFIRTRLLETSAISDLVDGRITTDVLDQGTDYPAIRTTIVSTETEENLDQTEGISHSRVQIDCYSRSRPEANSLAKLVRTQIRFSGTLQNFVVHGVTTAEGIHSTYHKPEDGTAGIRVTTQDFLISYEV